ncbi:tyrosine-type recombinase/integrase [Nitrosomonas sp. HPC101]|uniref:phage integrase n=1 Tax=Nitrosomonas sp. HPC101 TaxID=1658667 RepID=UPI001F046FB8|nr:tyrosine-type recombinase/integrase [Nitrosomonas sp. HPC101]
MGNKMAITKSKAGWLADVQPGGRGSKRYRKTFRIQAEAKVWETWIRAQVNSNSAWSPEKRDMRKLSSLAELWYESHGKELQAGEDTYKRIKALIVEMRDPMASDFDVIMFTKYRAGRIDAGITLSTVNREHAYLRAMFNELIRLGSWKKDNPLKDLRQFKVQENELSYLNSEQILPLLEQLQASSNVHVYLVAKICLSTGARWSEAEGLTLTQVRNGIIQFARTKSGKTRAVPIAENLEQEIHAHHKTHKRSNVLFDYCTGAFKEAIERTKIDLPPGQLTHVLRHTFASHFMINGGNILTLQRVLGHRDLKTTMRYAHLASSHLEAARALNPIAALTVG